MNDEDLSREYIGDISITYKDKSFIIEGAMDKVFPFEEIKNPIVTLRRNFNINHEGKHYLIKIDQYVTSFLRVIQSKY